MTLKTGTQHTIISMCTVISISQESCFEDFTAIERFETLLPLPPPLPPPPLSPNHVESEGYITLRQSGKTVKD
jgi:hypothetical protein